MESRPLVIANPGAGRGRTGRELPALLEPLRQALGDIDVVLTTHAGHATELAAAASGRSLVISLGGDGTLSEVVNGLLGGGEAPPPAAALPRLGIVAAGTGGDFGRTLGIPARFQDYVAAVASGAERTVDVGLARFTDGAGRPTRRLWINVLSAGIGGLVDRYTAAAPALMPGRIAYAQATLRAIVACRRVPLRCRAVLPDGRIAERLLNAYAVAVCNGSTFGAGMRVAPMAQPDDGLLEVITFETPTKLRMALRLTTLYAGRHLRQPGVAHFTCRSLTLEPISPWEPGRTHDERHRPSATHPSTGLFPLDVDGDALGDVPLEVGLLPRALRVCVPAGHHTH
jgi:YegS/Rv2252/BmrU family lipid kinase